MSTLPVILAAEGEEFAPPGPIIFEYPGIADSEFTKPMLIVVLCTVLLALFFLASSRRAAMVPSKLQFAGESVYGFVRNDLAVETIGKEGLKYAPFLATLFSFIALNNLMGIIPFFQLPSTSKIAIPMGLAAMAWALYMYVGIKHAGFVNYFKNMMFPPGIPIPIYFILAPIELFSNVFVRPVTHCLRLALNMFAGHIVLVLFVLGGEHLIFEYGGAVGIASGSVSILGAVVLTFFEAFVQILQAYVFTLLTALYIGGALADEH